MLQKHDPSVLYLYSYCAIEDFFWGFFFRVLEDEKLLCKPIYMECCL